SNLATRYPRVKSIYYFNVNNLVNAPEGRRINNYAITDNASILNTYARLISSPHFLSEAAPNRQGSLDPELMVVPKPLHMEQGRLYIPAAEMEKHLGITIQGPASAISVRIIMAGSKSVLHVEASPVYVGAAGELYLPLRAAAEHLG